MTASAVLGAVGSAIVLFSLFEMMRRHRLREKYALIWAVVAVMVLLVAGFPVLLQSLADLLGIQVPANLLFFGASLMIMMLTLQHSSELGRLEERTRTLAEEIALLRLSAERADGMFPTPAAHLDAGSVPTPQVTVDGPDGAPTDEAGGTG